MSFYKIFSSPARELNKYVIEARNGNVPGRYVPSGSSASLSLPTKSKCAPNRVQKSSLRLGDSAGVGYFVKFIYKQEASLRPNDRPEILIIV